MSGVGDSALNWYSRRLAREIESAGVHVSVVAPRAEAEGCSPWAEAGGVSVHPCFRREASYAAFQAYRHIVRLNSPIVHVQHELFAFGGLGGALLLPTALRLLDLRGKKVLTTIHGVIPLASVTEQFVRANRIPGNAASARALWRLLIRAVASTSRRVHVHEEFLRRLLVDEYGVAVDKIDVIPLGVEPAPTVIPRTEARRKYCIPDDAEVALFFGYMAAYKGIEYLLSEMNLMLSSRPNLHIIIAGAVPSRLEGAIDPALAVRDLAVGAERVHLVGFVPDDETASVFSAADVVLLPYRVAMSASGPLALAAGYDVPVLLSEAFIHAFPDAPAHFALTPGALNCALVNFMVNGDLRLAYKKFISRLREERSWPRVAANLIAVYQQLLGT